MKELFKFLRWFLLAGLALIAFTLYTTTIKAQALPPMDYNNPEMVKAISTVDIDRISQALGDPSHSSERSLRLTQLYMAHFAKNGVDFEHSYLEMMLDPATRKAAFDTGISHLMLPVIDVRTASKDGDRILDTAVSAGVLRASTVRVTRLLYKEVMIDITRMEKAAMRL